MQAWFVAHGKLPDEAAGIGEFIPKVILAHAQRFAEKLVQLRLGIGASAHQFKQALQIMLNIPIVSVTIVLGGVITSALAAGKSGSVRFDPVAIGILRPDMAFILTKNVFIIAGTFQEKLIVRVIAERTC